MVVPERHWGDTRSQKKICSYDIDDLEYIRKQTEEYLPSDNFDAACVFEYKMICALRHYGKKSTEFENMQFRAYFHRNQLSEEQFSGEMALLGLVTSIDVRKHGESLVKPFLRE